MLNQSQEPATEKVGTVIDRRYRITGLLGRGGMGSVYRAEHVRIRRPVALKLLHPEYGAIDEIARRFEREAFATGRIDHPNIVTVSDFGELPDGTMFLVMELLDGVSLADVLADEKRLAPERALAITKHVLRGLGQAHACDIVHRDVKPENVLLVEHAGQRDFAKLLDFGIAKLLGEAEMEEGGEKLTQAGVAFGTPAYISPEQATGSATDHRADLYSTSAMLFEMLTGRAPFVSEEKLKLLAMHATRPAPRMRDVAPELKLPDELELVVARGLQKEPGDRYPTAAAFIADIDDYLASRAAAEGPTEAEIDRALALIDPIAPGTGRHSPVTVHTGMTTIGSDKKTWVYGGIFAAIVALVVFIVANAAGAGSSEALSRPLDDLVGAKSCAQRREAIPRLVEVGDPEAIPALEKARDRDDNKCLIKEANAAIAKLKQKQRPQP